MLACWLVPKKLPRAGIGIFLSVDKVWWESERSGTYPLEDECGGGGKVVIGTVLRAHVANL